MSLSSFKYVLLAAAMSFSTTVLAEAAEEGGTVYLEVNPPFTVNVGEPSARVSFAKTDVSLRLVDAAGKTRVQHHMPGIRDILVSALSNQPLPKVETSEGLEILRRDILEQVRQFLLQEEGEELVSDLLFTSFIVQR